ncbi:MAG: hypothetical protein LBT55_07900 [Clostridiaceae bacterium]|jgi:signal peptidase I|nr:hypothetical protein [Clostridiaceae bacterium]
MKQALDKNTQTDAAAEKSEKSTLRDDNAKTEKAEKAAVCDDNAKSEKSEKSKARRVINKITYALTITVFLAVVAVVISVAVQYFKGEKPSLFGYRFLYIQTDSMTPELQVGDVILSKVLQTPDDVTANVKEGDVITYIAEYGELKGLSITHKVVEAAHYDEKYSRYTVTTRGVKQGAMTDPPVPLENVEAVMVKNIKVFGAFYRFISSMEGLLIVIILPFGLMLGMLVYRLVIIIKKPARRKVSPERAAEIKAEIERLAVEEFLAAERRQTEDAERQTEIERLAVEEFLAAERRQTEDAERKTEDAERKTAAQNSDTHQEDTP